MIMITIGAKFDQFSVIEHKFVTQNHIILNVLSEKKTTILTNFEDDCGSQLNENTQIETEI